MERIMKDVRMPGIGSDGAHTDASMDVPACPSFSKDDGRTAITKAAVHTKEMTTVTAEFAKRAQMYK